MGARCLQLVVSLWVALTGIFIAVTQLPGDPVLALFGFERPDPEIYDRIRSRFHLDDPVWEQYVYYLRDVLTGDLGNSYPLNPYGFATVGAPVMDTILRTAPVSAVVVGCSLAVQIVAGLAAGVLSAGRGVALSRGVYVTALLLVATPVLVAAYSLRTVFGSGLGWLPVRGLHSGPESYVLPVLALSALSTGYVILLTRSELKESMGAPYIRAARARGIPATALLGRHALRPALIPVVAFIAANTGQLFVGLIIVEGIFDLPGMGGALFDSIAKRDRSLLIGLVTVVMTAVLVANAIADVLAALIDPRIRLAEVEA